MQTTSYDKAGRTTEIKAVAGSGAHKTTLEDHVYSYTAAGSGHSRGGRRMSAGKREKPDGTSTRRASCDAPIVCVIQYPSAQ